MNVSIIAHVSGNYSHLNWKWSSNSIPFDKQMTTSCHACWGQLSRKARGKNWHWPEHTQNTHMCTHTHATALDCVPFQLSSFKDAAAGSRVMLPTLPDVIFHLLPMHLSSGFCVWAAGQCHKDRSVLPLTSTAALKGNFGWSSHLSAGWTRGLIAP